MSEFPWTFECCGGERFVYLPGWGYTLMNYISVTVIVVVAIAHAVVLNVVSNVVRYISNAALPSRKLDVNIKESTSLDANVNDRIGKVCRWCRRLFAGVVILISAAIAVALWYVCYEAKRKWASNATWQPGENPQTHEWATKYTQTLLDFRRAGGTPELEEGLLTSKEANEVRSILLDMRDSWEMRGAGGLVPMYTVGGALYLDGLSRDYRARLHFSNAMLEEKFGWIYERILAALQKRLDGPVRLSRELSVPGFHIFMSHSLFQESLFRIHSDNQYVDLHHKKRKTSTENGRFFSFTLPIELPESAGLHVYFPGKCDSLPDTYYDKVYNESEIYTGEYRSGHKAAVEFNNGGYCRIFEPYRVGDMVMHEYFMVHSIAPSQYRGRQARITLQGHGVFNEDDAVWEVYW